MSPRTYDGPISATHFDDSKPPTFEAVAKDLREAAAFHRRRSDFWGTEPLGEKHDRYAEACEEAIKHDAAKSERILRQGVEIAELHATIAKLKSPENQHAKSL